MKLFIFNINYFYLFFFTFPSYKETNDVSIYQIIAGFFIKLVLLEKVLLPSKWPALLGLRL